MVQPGGPRSQRRRYSGLVSTSQTMARGASKSRVITISRSLGVVRVSGWAVGIGAFLLAVGVAALLALDGVHLFQQRIEAPVVGFPDPAEFLQPAGGVGERLRCQATRPSLGIPPPGHQSGPFQHLEMLRDGGLAD